MRKQALKYANRKRTKPVPVLGPHYFYRRGLCLYICVQILSIDLKLVHVQIHKQGLFVHSNLLENDSKGLDILKQIEALFATHGSLDPGHHAVNHIEDVKAVSHLCFVVKWDETRAQVWTEHEFLHKLHDSSELLAVNAQRHVLLHTWGGPASHPLSTLCLWIVAVEAHVRVQPHGPTAVIATDDVVTRKQRIHT